MILYTIVPIEVIFSGGEDSYEKKYIELEYLGERVIVIPLENNSFKIDRVISTSPKAFLNPALQPGTIVSGVRFS